MGPFWSGPSRRFRETQRADIVGKLAAAHVRHFRTSTTHMLRAWEESIDLLRDTLAALPGSVDWWVLLEYPMLRLGRRADAILLTGHAIIVLEFKIGATSFDHAGRAQVEDYALDLQDFHAGCRNHPIIPVLVATDARTPAIAWPLLLSGTSPVLDANRRSLPGLLAALAARAATGASPFEPQAWLRAPYRPVPTIVEAACMLYNRHGSTEIAAARADAQNLTLTTETILREIADARAAGQKLILFITGIPGAGKTLCGLNVAFGGEGAGRATFLTGNPTLVHVLREALARDAIARGGDCRAARQQMEGAIQPLPLFRDHHVATGEIPAERVVVIDEAQRCWSAAHAIAKTHARAVRLTDSEPGHLLDIMGRHDGFCAVICLVGQGQEIHSGEGGLAEWAVSLQARPGWRVRSAPQAACGMTGLDLQPVIGLHLDVPVRQIRNQAASTWVEHVLAGNAAMARLVALEAGDIPFRLTRSLPAMRQWLRQAARGSSRRCGLIASSGAARLRAEGLGVELPHMDAQAVARWFLDRWPDVRASDALETVATEFSCQGLELDFAGLCWDADLVRDPRAKPWRVRSFRGNAWTLPKRAEAIANRINTYRVLLTRARYETIIFVPPGDARDPTRDPGLLDGIADFLAECGAAPLDRQEMAPAPPAPSSLQLL